MVFFLLRALAATCLLLAAACSSAVGGKEGPNDDPSGPDGGMPDGGVDDPPEVDAAVPDPTTTYAAAFIPIDVGSDKPLATQEYFREQMGKVRELYLENSYGQVGMQGLGGDEPDLYDPVNVSITLPGGEDCPYDHLVDLASTEAAASGIPLDDYDFLVYGVAWEDCVFPTGISLSERVLLVRAGVFPGNGYHELHHKTIAHEIGHSMGLRHANGLRCTDSGQPAPIGDSCTEHTYQDPADVMGGGAVHFSALFKDELEWLEPTSVADVTSSGEYALKPVESGSTEPMVLKVARGSETLAVEYRRPDPDHHVRPNGELVPGGVYLRLQAGASQATRLIDMHPHADEETWEFTEDAALSVGQTFDDPQTGISITNLDESDDEARVHIEL